ncbi:MAG: NAD-dependent epimerase/dehydratase family protein [Actinobacteria bacterium]|nr:NAD-dependent epimerase/dehydratase family protein [Actinomycetota bacterium]
MKVMVTGGAGFIGSTLVDRLLADGHVVDVVDDLSSGPLANLSDARARGRGRFSFHRLDVRSTALSELIAVRRPEVVMHLAGQVDVRTSFAKPLLDAEVNILGSINVCQGAVAARTRKVVFAGSGTTLYGEPDELPAREGHPQQPHSPHGVAKKAVADYLHAYRVAQGLESTVLALADVYGPRQDTRAGSGVVAIFAGRLLTRERATIFGDGTQTRDFVFVDDVVDAFVAAIEGGGGLTINVGTGVGTSVQALYDAMARLTGTDDPPRRAEARPGDVLHSVLDPGRAGTHLGWEPRTDLESGLVRTLAWYRDRM